jgi:hypothetical protein
LISGAAEFDFFCALSAGYALKRPADGRQDFDYLAIFS